MFGCPTEKVTDKQPKCSPQTGSGRLIGEESMVDGSRGRFKVLKCASKTLTRVCRPSMAAETRGLGVLIDSLQFYVEMFREILGGERPSSFMASR